MLASIGPATGVRAQVPLPEPGLQQSIGSASLAQDVVVSVSEINAFQVADGAVTLTVDAAVAGQGIPAVQTGTTYGLTTNGTGKKITAALSNEYAAGLTLALSLAAPAGAASTPRTLSTTAQDVVTGLSQIAASALAVTYTVSATLAAAPNAGGETRTVTFTLTDM